MKRGLICLIIIFLLIPVISAEISIQVQEQPNELYNFGSIIELPLKISTTTDLEGTLTADLLCNGKQEQYYKNYLTLSEGADKTLEARIPLKKNFINAPGATCKLKIILGGEYKLSEEFSVSNVIDVELNNADKEALPNEEIIVDGKAVKEDGTDVDKNGFAELNLTHTNSSKNIFASDDVEGGYFRITRNLSEDTESGDYDAVVSVFEKNSSGSIINKGSASYTLVVGQVPTSLEIILGNESIKPGNDLEIKPILHDQTGKPIDANSIITIKKNNRIKAQEQLKTGEVFNFPIKYNEPVSDEWEVVAVSRKITTEQDFSIQEKKDTSIEIINRTLIINNTGNVPYNNSVLVEIGNKTLNLNVSLEVGETKKYTLSAPEGKYNVSINSEGAEEIRRGVSLTGNAIGIKESSTGVFSLFRPFFVWIFVVLVIGLFAFITKKKLKKQKVFTLPRKKNKTKETKKEKKEKKQKKSSSWLYPQNKAELSLSLKGEKQSSSLVDLNIKNFEKLATEVKEEENVGVKQTLQKIVNYAEKNNALTYQSNNHIFFILAPIKTKTFDNQKATIDIANQAIEYLQKHNKLFKDKIEFGISLNHGDIVFKQEEESAKFMAMGSFLSDAKKASNLSNQEVLLTKEMNERVSSIAKTEKLNRQEMDLYRIKETKNPEQHKKFLSEFVKRIEGKS